MPFIPHTPEDVKTMLSVIAANNIETLFEEIPPALPRAQLTQIPSGLNEASISRLMREREPHTDSLCFIGAGAYEHHIPAAVWELTTRGEFYTAYTPYQAEASQGSLQLIYEYQTMIAELMDMEISNASLYDGATALVETILMAVRCHPNKLKTILWPANIHPYYQNVANTILKQQEITLTTLPFDKKQGTIDLNKLDELNTQALSAIVIPQPNFFGCLEEVDTLTHWAHRHGLLVIACVNPTAMALLKPPGQWGDTGADIVCGEGQPLGVPLAFGGPYFGFLCTKKSWIRQMPGRIVGRTQDTHDNEGFTLTLQAREQHIRRSKATSNICTNQGLLLVAASIYLSLMGASGLKEVALTAHQNTVNLMQRLSQIDGVTIPFSQPIFHEFVLQTQQPISEIITIMRKHHIQAGFNLTSDFPELGNALLICATETKTPNDLTTYEYILKKIIAE